MAYRQLNILMSSVRRNRQKLNIYIFALRLAIIIYNLYTRAQNVYARYMYRLELMSIIIVVLGNDS